MDDTTNNGITFRPRGLLANTHLQSILNSSALRRRRLARQSADYLLRSRREVLSTPDDVHLLAWHAQPAAANGALVVLLHGWEGSADSNYLLDTAMTLDRAGFETVRLNLRDHGDSHHLNEGLFHSCRLKEVIDAVAILSRRHGGGPVYLAGFSLGGNFALRVARQASAHDFRLDMTVAVCPVIRPRHVLDALATGFPLYHHYFVRKWRRSLQRKQRLYPERYNLADWFRLTRLEDQTRELVIAHTEFPDLDSYLEGYSIAGDYLAGLEVPSLIIAAADDPIIPRRDIEALPRTPALEIEIHPAGGHCGFLLDWRLNSWIGPRIEKALWKHLRSS
ncbi:MAG: alpha/beta fold hydrolase [Wenzhouxiangellaceae bacterium]